ncbi:MULTISPECIES: hypothetical protein [unclassified Duganella]|uniref:hypothetical protein n=1 Tax=unclassified Duganella TaxID=2636909 RepID=UPI0006FB9D0A|nr:MULTISPECIES: hypothetical protein [unclassified Duganella]KQV59016.1 hypothetical protein ASD07_25580 [Duganella sp. Root336D2]KRC02488.1 hypothetical protein ASE26_18395 [Duganella sp. Root198D2]
MANEQQPGKQLSAKGAARRRFTRAGAAASGVLLTLHSQPGMAAVVCAGPSGFQSGLVSARPNDPGACAGRSPGYWKNTDPVDSSGGQGNGKGGGKKPTPAPLPDKVWPAGALPTDKFRSVFTCTLEMNSTYGSDSCTLDFILGSGATFDTDKLGAHLVAAYLNVLDGKSGFQSVPMLQNIWNELRNTGYFSPTAGVKWDAKQVVDYLSGTMA